MEEAPALCSNYLVSNDSHQAPSSFYRSYCVATFVVKLVVALWGNRGGPLFQECGEWYFPSPPPFSPPCPRRRMEAFPLSPPLAPRASPLRWARVPP
eukprot:scaffold420_cov342-Pavlova_lutheri.AAC.2